MNFLIAMGILSAMAITGIIFGFLITNLIDYKSIINNDELYLRYSQGSRTLAAYKLPRFSFHQFTTFYTLNPNSWEIITEHDQYIPAKKELTTDLVPDASSSYKYVSAGTYLTPRYTVMHPIFFKNFFEYLKYKTWAKHTLKVNRIAKLNETQLQNTQTIVNLVQKDINKIIEENHKTLEEVTTNVVDTYIRLNQEATK